jgi:hypothetical protein
LWFYSAGELTVLSRLEKYGQDFSNHAFGAREKLLQRRKGLRKAIDQIANPYPLYQECIIASSKTKIG